ncbi:MAG: alpha/beta fold hydrolase [Candidatus Methylomirabilis sp.]|nr:alpha/beta fold hydrolase [Deltaproteobacteria bacterium]
MKKQYRLSYAVRRGCLSSMLLLGILTSCDIDSGPLPVIFVHGLGGEVGDSFATMRAWLVKGGYEAAFLREFKMSDSYRNCIETSAGELKLAVDRFMQETGAPKIDIVGHSLGGLVTRYYVKSLGGDKKVRNVVTLASPHHGTLLAGDNPWFCSVTQMAPTSAFLNNLNKTDETPGTSVLWTSYRNAADPFVIPFESPIIAGARNETVPENHVTMLTSPGAFAKVQEGLEGGGLNTR